MWSLPKPNEETSDEAWLGTSLALESEAKAEVLKIVDEYSMKAESRRNVVPGDVEESKAKRVVFA